MRKKRTIIHRGLYTTRAYEFNIDKKLRPQDPLLIFEDGQMISRSVESWISINPIRIWDKIYYPDTYHETYQVPLNKESRKLSLCTNAYSLLRQAIDRTSPERLKALEAKKRKRVIG